MPLNEFIVPLMAVVFVIVLLAKGVTFVPQNRAYVVERFGKYNTTFEAGLNFLVPFIDKIAYDRSLKEQAIDVAGQAVITKDNITLNVDGVLYLKVINPEKASYGIDDYVFAVIQLAQTTMRSELGKIELDKTFEERDTLNSKIVTAINEASHPWGVQVLRYEIKDIAPPMSVLDAMERQMKAEREKRAAILHSEGERQAAINQADGEKQAAIKKAEGEAAAILAVANAQAEALKTVGEVASGADGHAAVQFELAKEAIIAKQNIAKESSVVLLPDNATDISSVVAQAMTVMNKLPRN